MTVKPILFSVPMIQALLDGRKTQTRRVLKPQPLPDGYYEGEVHCTNVPAGARFAARAVGGGAITTDFIEYPHRVGDVLWVREGWTQDGTADGMVAYRAEGEPPAHIQCKWRSPMFMPRWASRITLAVTEVRVQRLQEISEDDALAEGLDCAPASGFDFATGRPLPGFRYADGGFSNMPGAYKRAWSELWNTIHGPGSWDANPWVVAISFDVHLMNVDAYLARAAEAA